MGTRPFPYPGSKAVIADWIVDHMPQHERYVEAFGGAAAVLFTKPHSEIEVYNDLDGSLVTFFEVLRDRPDELREWLDACPLSREQHDKWSKRWYEQGERPDDDVEHAGQFFYLRYSQWNGKHGSQAEFQHRGGKKADEFRRAVDRIGEFVDRFSEVTIEKMDYKDLISEYNRDDTLFYFDPELAGWTGDDLFEEEAISPREFVDALDEIEGYWQASVVEESMPPVWEERDDVWITSREYRSYTEYIVMNYDPLNTPSFEVADGPENDSLDATW